ncbi:MAG: hypothetical protein WDO56_01295 [Gammaproteobacteria bacterium]
MILRQLQELIGGIYDVSVTHDVYDFLVTSREQLPAAVRASGTDEELIVAEGGDAIGVSLYLDPALLERLRKSNPLVRLDESNVADYWTALEGVSHFLYLAWNAGHDKPVSLMELELQAEIDKYVASYLLLKRQFPGRFPVELLHILFERTRIDPQLAQGRENLYRAATRHAEKFCRRLADSLNASRPAVASEMASGVLAELRRFYRLTDVRKLAHIEKFA